MKRLYIFCAVACLAFVQVPGLAQVIQTQQFLNLPDSTTATTSREDQLHALSLTRFHFTTLKAFHNNLYLSAEEEQSIPPEEANILNTVIEQFLVEPGREEILLQALREDKAIRLEFEMYVQTDRYQMSDHPTKPILYHVEPVRVRIPMYIDIRPLLDGPIAFEITLNREHEQFLYDVDWRGAITSHATREVRPGVVISG